MTITKSMISFSAAALLIAGLAGCGGSTSGGVAGTGESTVQVEDDAVSGAAVTASGCGTATDLGGGTYKFTTCTGGDGVYGTVTSTGGYVDLDGNGISDASDYEFPATFVMQAPASTSNPRDVVTPFTTLLIGLTGTSATAAQIDSNLTALSQKLGVATADLMSPPSEFGDTEAVLVAKFGVIIDYATRNGTSLSTLAAGINAQTTTGANIITSFLENNASLISSDTDVAANLNKVFATFLTNSIDVLNTVRTNASTLNDPTAGFTTTAATNPAMTGAGSIQFVPDANITSGTAVNEVRDGVQVDSGATDINVSFDINKNAELNITAGTTGSMYLKYFKNGTDDNTSVTAVIEGLFIDGNTTYSTSYDSNISFDSNGTATLSYAIKDENGTTVDANSTLTTLALADLNTSIVGNDANTTIQVKDIFAAILSKTASTSGVSDFNSTGKTGLTIAIATSASHEVTYDDNSTASSLVYNSKQYYTVADAYINMGTADAVGIAPDSNATFNKVTTVATTADTNKTVTAPNGSSQNTFIIKGGQGTVDRNITLDADANATGKYQIFTNTLDSNVTFTTIPALPDANTSDQNVTISFDTNQTVSNGHPFVTLTTKAFSTYGIRSASDADSNVTIMINRFPELNSTVIDDANISSLVTDTADGNCSIVLFTDADADTLLIDVNITSDVNASVDAIPDTYGAALDFNISTTSHVKVWLGDSNSTLYFGCTKAQLDANLTSSDTNITIGIVDLNDTYSETIPSDNNITLGN